MTAALLLAPPGSFARGSADKGTSAAAFLKLGAGARASAMGGAFAGVADDAAAAYYNPAGLAFLKRPEATGMHESRYAGLAYDYATVAVPLLAWVDTPRQRNARGVAALSVYSLSAGGIERRGTTETDQPLDTFGARDFAYALSYAYNPAGTGLGLGGTAKVVDSSIDRASGRALAVDAGALYRADRLSAGLGWRHLGTRQKIGSVADPLPFAWFAGGAWRFPGGLLASLELDLPRDGNLAGAVGGEYRHEFGRRLSGTARLGFNSGVRDPGGLSGFSLGFGLRYDMADLDFAWLPGGELGDSFRYSLLVRF
ncbi:MAG: PorV/PorQ family protein [Elusimicrobia bacterium]|nr:PorV/PorQ family protein [Elusimicrobiota bacterium]